MPAAEHPRPDDGEAHDTGSARVAVSPPAIVAEGFTFQPAGPDGPTPIRGLDLHVPAGASLLVAGPTGSGKSLFLSCLAGLGHRHPDPRVGGRLAVVFDPEDDGFGAARLPVPHPGRVMLVPQEPGDGLLGLDVVSSLALPLEEQGRSRAETARRVEAALDGFGILGLAERDVATLSGGERRRVALAAVEAVDPGLVLLDEPLAGLDPAGTRRVLDDLHRLRARRTVVVAEHRTNLLRPLVDATLHLVPPATAATAAPRRLHPEDRQGGGGEMHVAGLVVQREGRRLLGPLDARWGPGVVALLGPNGAGKTTLLETLAGLHPPAAGSVAVGRLPIWRDACRPRGWRRRERTLRRHLAFAAQDPRDVFFAADVRDEVAAPLRALRLTPSAREARAHAERVLGSAGMAGLTDRAPSRLSGGEARLVQAVGALAAGPDVWLVDEPTHGLDPEARSALADAVSALAAGGGLVVVATHEPGWLPAVADWLFLPGDGTVLTGAAARPDAPGPAAAGYREGLAP